MLACVIMILLRGRGLERERERERMKERLINSLKVRERNMEETHTNDKSKNRTEMAVTQLAD